MKIPAVEYNLESLSDKLMVMFNHIQMSIYS